jgi:hypothetical protein
VIEYLFDIPFDLFFASYFGFLHISHSVSLISNFIRSYAICLLWLDMLGKYFNFGSGS